MKTGQYQCESRMMFGARKMMNHGQTVPFWMRSVGTLDRLAWNRGHLAFLLRQEIPGGLKSADAHIRNLWRKSLAWIV